MNILCENIDGENACQIWSLTCWNILLNSKSFLWSIIVFMRFFTGLYFDAQFEQTNVNYLRARKIVFVWNPFILYEFNTEKPLINETIYGDNLPLSLKILNFCFEILKFQNVYCIIQSNSFIVTPNLTRTRFKRINILK